MIYNCKNIIYTLYILPLQHIFIIYYLKRLNFDGFKYFKYHYN